MCLMANKLELFPVPSSFSLRIAKNKKNAEGFPVFWGQWELQMKEDINTSVRSNGIQWRFWIWPIGFYLDCVCPISAVTEQLWDKRMLSGPRAGKGYVPCSSCFAKLGPGWFLFFAYRWCLCSWISGTEKVTWNILFTETSRTYFQVNESKLGCKVFSYLLALRIKSVNKLETMLIG